jgi:hypothetical protein
MHLDSVDCFNAVGGLQPTILHIDGKIWAEQSAQPAIDAVSVTGQFRRMVAFGIGAFRHGKDILGAELDTKPAPLASIFDDMNNAVRHLDAVPIQGLSPVGHIPSSIRR